MADQEIQYGIRKKTMNTVLIAWLFFFALSAGANARSKSDLQKVVYEHHNGAVLKHALWSVFAEYADTGDEIISLNGNKSLAPASVLKLITTGAALITLGENFRFKTELYYDGDISENGILHGNIYVVGGGSPTLGSDRVDGPLALDNLMRTWAAAIKKRGISQIDGKIVADISLFDEKTISDFWSWGDIGNYYGAGTSALCIHDNLYYLYFKPGRQVGDIAKVLRTRPIIEDLTFNNYIRTGKAGSGDRGYIYCAPGQKVATLRGTIPSGPNEFTIKGSIPNPPLFTIQYLAKFLKKSGILVSGQAAINTFSREYQAGKLIHVSHSPPLSKIVEIANKRSVNLYVEQLVKMIALKETGKGNTKDGIKAIKKVLESFGIDTGGFTIFDGSGLSRSNMATTKIVAKFLSAMSKQGLFETFYHSLSIAGNPNDIGFLKKFAVGTPVAGNARIKTGTLTGVRSHSGYVHTSSGKLISFSLICNNFSTSVREINNIHKEVLVQLAILP